MSRSVSLVWSDSLLRYDLGGSHPMSPARLRLTMALADELGLLGRPNLQVVPPEVCADLTLQRFHDPGYVAAVRAASGPDGTPPPDGTGLGSADNPIVPGLHESSSLVVGGSLAAAAAVRSGAAQHGVNLAGGHHHAMRERASGFCTYNDAAIAIAWLLADGVRRIAYVDLDAHHGDGVEAAYYDDPRVLTISLHESGYTAFPGTGFPQETGGPHALGSAANVALPSYTGDAGWLRALHAVVPPLVRAFEPEVLVTQLGCDSHRLDPLAALSVSIEAHRGSYALLHSLAHEVSDGRWVALGGGGYDLVNVVPLSWTHLLAELSGEPLGPAATPARWRDLVLRTTGRRAPAALSDSAPVRFRPWDAGEGDPDDRLDRAVAATRRAVFPEHGLDPYDPR